jgi:hypothetical protein
MVVKELMESKLTTLAEDCAHPSLPPSDTRNTTFLLHIFPLHTKLLDMRVKAIPHTPQHRRSMNFSPIF